MKHSILENGEELLVDDNQLKIIGDMIYHCPECNVYHVKYEFSLNQIEEKLEQKAG